MEIEDPPSAVVPSSAIPANVNDPHRIRGGALRRSLYFTMIAWIPGAFWQGMTNGSPGVELARHLGANDFVFSLMAVAPLVSVLLQIPGSLMVEKLGARKKFFIWMTTPHRTLYIVMGLLPWIAPANVVWPAMLLVLVLLLSMSLSNFGGQAWTNWMADLVPPRVRGKYFAARSRLGIAVVCVSGLAVAVLMDLCGQKGFKEWMWPVERWSGMEPLVFCISIVFMVAGLVGMLDILSFIKVDEPPMRAAAREPIEKRIFRPLHDGNFLRFVAYWSVWTAAQSFCGWVWWVFLLDFFASEKARGNHAWWLEHRYVAATLILGVAFQVGQFLGYPIWGRAVDRFGRRPVLFISSTFHSIGWMWWIFLSPALLPWLLLTQFFGGFMYGGQDIASFNMMLEFNRRGGPNYQAVGSVIFSVVGAAAALAAGLLAEWLKDFHWTLGAGTAYEHTFNRYAVLIAVATAIKYAGDFIFLPAVQDLGGKARRDALRFVFDNTYSSVNTIIFLPLRVGAGIAGRGIYGVIGVADAASEGIKRLWR